MADVDFSQLTPEQLDALLELPALAPPPGEVNNLNPSNRNGMAVAIMIICLTVVVICLSIRIYARLFLLKVVQIQDYVLMGAFTCFLGWVTCTLMLTETMGYYVHQWNISYGQLVKTGFRIHLASNFYTATLPLIKVSILVEWMGVFVPRGTKNWFFWTSWVLIAIQIMFAISCFFALNMTCFPTRKKWEFWVPGKCTNGHDIETASASVQLASDFAILILPQKVIWDLQMGWRKKVGVSVIFSLGAFACIAAAFRLATNTIYAEAADVIWQVPPVVFWAYAEMTCGFIVICIPCVPRILNESGVWRKMKQSLGMSVTTGAIDATTKNRTGTSTTRSKNMRSVSNSYLELDDTEMKGAILRVDGVPPGQV